MCGLLGIVSKNLDSISQDFLVNLNKLNCRGPDEQKIEQISGQIKIGFCRLSIVDEINGSQPISNKEKKVWLMLNGEIYNYRDLKAKIASVYKFKTESDSEVVLALYEIYGINFVNMISGMYAIVIIDLSISKIFFLRDKFGEKPLYYRIEKNNFVFGSTLDAVLLSKITQKEVNIFAVEEYLRYNYFPTQNLVFDVQSFKPNFLYQYDIVNLSLDKSRIQDEKKDFFIHNNNFEKSALVNLKKILLESVEESLIGDQLPGVMISSGVDSTLVSNLLYELNYESKLFSLDFTQKNFAEFNDIKFSPKQSKMIGNLNRVEFDFGKLPSIDYLVKSMGEPLGDSSILAIWAITDYLKHNGIKVSLTGDGGDELLRGYKSYDATRLHYLFTANGYFNRFWKALDLSRFIKDSDRKVGFSTKLKRFLYGLQFPTNQSHPIWTHSWTENKIQGIFKLQNLSDPVSIKNNYSNLEELLDNCQQFDIDNYLQKDILIKADRGSMMNSVELRAPLLNKKLTNFILSREVQLLNQKLVPKFGKKALFKMILKEDYGIEFSKSTKKGFSVPIDDLIRTRYKDEIWNIISEYDVTSEFFDNNLIQKEFNLHLMKKTNNGFSLWGIVLLIKWLQIKFS